MKDYRKIWEAHHGVIPEGYEIHHIDGNHENNNIGNLLCVSVEEHYEIHKSQGDWFACKLIATRMNLSIEERKLIHKLAMEKRDQAGNKNPMYGRSAVKEQNMKWFTDGIVDKMFVDGEQPDGWERGRVNMPKYNRSSKNNPKAKVAIVNGKEYDCLKDALKDYPDIPYSSLKGAARRGYSAKYNLTVEYK